MLDAILRQIELALTGCSGRWVTRNALIGTMKVNSRLSGYILFFLENYMSLRFWIEVKHSLVEVVEQFQVFFWCWVHALTLEDPHWLFCLLGKIKWHLSGALRSYALTRDTKGFLYGGIIVD